MPRWHDLPPEVYRLVERQAGSVLLESAAAQPEAKASAQPESTVSALAAPSAQSRLFLSPARVLVAGEPAELPGIFAQIERAVDAGLHAAGYFSYECGACLEPAASSSKPPKYLLGAEPLAWFGIYERAYVFDHGRGAFVHGDPPGLEQFREADGGPSEVVPHLDCAVSLSEEQYAGRIAEIHELIRAGDIYQLNLTMPIRVRTAASSDAVYRQLRARQPAPYGAFLHTQAGSRILSFSPELFFRIDPVAAPDHRVPHPFAPSADGWETTSPRRITARPMKGTARRGRTTAEDRAQAAWLAADAKNRAENVMIVDLLRNDLGRLCSFGSVEVSHLFAVERYPTLWQMTSTVSGDLRAGVGFEEIFRALFPCGSITGAPKIRAMQRIGELEQEPRGVYTGAIGHFSKDLTVFNVAIRTLALRESDGEQQGAMGVGSGIVIDSEPAEEWAECQLKSQFLTAEASSLQGAPADFSLVETMLWRGSYPYLELHLDRLEDSAHYFGYPFDRTEVQVALASHQGYSTHPRKVRLLLNSAGDIEITSEAISEPGALPLRVRIATQQTDSRDPFYCHKTTHRAVYAQAFKQALEAGYDDVLFLNERGEVTEAAIHNVFVERAGRLLTPPVECGVLPGIQRRHILASNPAAEERVLTLEDLHQADAVYLSNAVRGLRPAIVDWNA